MNKTILSPLPLKFGDTIGVFTPSGPGYIWNEGLFSNGIKNLEKLGFKVIGIKKSFAGAPLLVTADNEYL
jgi:muramoyltetrapeptide carboxypeptidase LdcA involved in peptidoglycan recycling